MDSAVPISDSVIDPWILPDFRSSFATFLASYPEYMATISIDSIRRSDYSHLDKDHQVCLDYSGIGLFSRPRSALTDFSLAYASASLVSHALYGNSRDSIEGLMRARVLDHLKLDQRAYLVVFAADSFSALRLLVDSFSFHDSPRVLHGYDFKNKSLDRIEAAARAVGAKVMHTTLSSTALEHDRESLRRKLLSGKRNKKPKGIFVYPLVSRVTGTENSIEWIREARRNRWLIVVDISGAASYSSAELAELSPEFVVGSFYKVFGMDPAGFGCLVIKRTMLQTLDESSCHGARGMVKIVRDNPYFQVPEPFMESKNKSEKVTNISIRSLTSGFQGLDHVEKLGKLSKLRQESLLGWLRTSLLALRHSLPGHPNLVTVHSPEDAVTTIAFSLLNEYGEFIDPPLVQRLANRFNISLATGVIQAQAALDSELCHLCVRKMEVFSSETSVRGVVCATVGLLTTFRDVFKLWEFVAQFLDSDFCSREILQYRGLDQQTVFL